MSKVQGSNNNTNINNRLLREDKELPIDKKIVDQIINVIVKTYCSKKKKPFIYKELKNLRNRL